MKLTRIRPEFVMHAPDVLERGVVYVSMEYATVLHLCCCGCDSQVVTPLSPARWKLWFDGEAISLDPSIGNWSFSCRSHYWIEGNEVVWSRAFDEDEVEAVRSRDRRAMTQHLTSRNQGEESAEVPMEERAHSPWLDRVWRWIERRRA